jgi:hypothetical protein
MAEVHAFVTGFKFFKNRQIGYAYPIWPLCENLPLDRVTSAAYHRR